MSLRITTLAIALAAACGVAAAEELSQKTWTDRQGDQTTLRSGQPDMKDFGPPPDFASLDTNSDGVIDVGESHGYPMLYIDYEFADHNRDRRVSRREYEHWVQHGEDPGARR